MATTSTDDGSNGTGPVLIAGGYGVVGAQVARLLRERHPQLPLLLGGRRPERGAALAQELGEAEAVPLDLSAARANASDLLASLPQRPAAILCVVNDPGDRLLAAAIEQGIPIADITRWTALVHRALARCAATPPRAPVLLASGWMAGAVPLAVAWAAGGGADPLAVASVASDVADPLAAARAAFDVADPSARAGAGTPGVAASAAPLDRVDIAIRYAMADRSGPDSVEYVDRFAERFETTVDGVTQRVAGLSDPRAVTFADGARGRVYRLDTPEQLTLPATLGARTVATRIGFDSASATAGLAALRRLGILRAISGARFTGIRRALLHQPGDGGTAQVRIDLAWASGGADGASGGALGTRGGELAGATTRTIHLSDPLGQSHMTAAGAVVAVERLLALDGAPPEPAGARFPEQHPAPAAAIATLRACGVAVA
jgi:hypothetical protein